MTTMPFGRHRGEPLDKIPTDYLLWATTIELKSLFLRMCIITELEARGAWSTDDHRQRREHHEPPPPPSTTVVPAEIRPTAEELIAAGLRALTRKHHPDLGGSHDGMVRVNLTAETLRRVVAR